MRGTASAQVAETTGRGAEVDIEGLSEEEAAEAIARARDEELRYPAELASAIRYTDISAGADVEYVLSGRSLKENITL
ncbi:MAG: hypothetical protein FWE69_08600, partial [Clostridiales bacterium]|nr:hypothetical protein [Clostridiales bacterium]